MTTAPRRLLAALAAATLLFLVVGCGVESNVESAAPTIASNDDTSASTTAPDTADDETTTTEDSSSDDETTIDDSGSDDETTTTEFDDSGSDTTDGSGPLSTIPDDVREQIIKTYTDMGLSEDQANCLLDALVTNGDQIDSSDISAMMDFLDQCDISITDFNMGG